VTEKAPKSSGSPTQEQLEMRLELAVETRKLEIDLFWRRSFFFWGFISASFIAYASLYKEKAIGLELVISSFGFICSFAWSLVNRGSKYWQENWERKVEQVECEVLGEPFFAEREEVQKPEIMWLRARQFSVSKLAIALSDFTVVLWLALMAWTAWSPTPVQVASISHCLKIAIPVASIIFALMLLCLGRTSPPSNSHAKKCHEP